MNEVLMSEVFLKIINMSISASWLVLAVLLLRLVLKKAPKWVSVLLWGFVAVRLVCPFSIESVLSLIPSAETVSPEIMMDWTPEISTGIGSVDTVINPIITQTFAPQPLASANPLQILIPVAGIIWLVGIAVMLLYTAVSYFLLRRKVATAVLLRNNIYQSENVDSPFVLGIIKPKIYLPFQMDGKNLEHVIAHEESHIRRKDHWWKPFGFVLLALHWFNPLMWLGYVLLCRDIELACDEKVIKEMDNENRADYTQALVACSVNRRSIAACPLAFGEVGVKARVKSVMNYKKPAFWIIVSAALACVVIAVCFLTNPLASPELEMSGNNVSDMDVDAVIARIHKVEGIKNGNVYMNSNNFGLTVDSGFNWVDSQAVRYFFYKGQKTHSAQLRIFPEENKYHITESSEWIEQNQIFLLRHYLDAIKYLPQSAIRQIAPADQYLIYHVEDGVPGNYDRVISYSSSGVGETDGWFIHLRVEPLHANGEGFTGTGEEVVHLFYWDAHDQSGDINKLLSLVNEIADNPDCAASSNPFTYIEARKARYNEILTYGSAAVDFFVEQLRAGENGLRGYIMAVACANITGIGDKDLGADWATAQEWLALYDKNDKNTIVPPVIATDYISGKQARLLSFGYTSDKPGQSVIACGIAPWQGDYGYNNTLVLDGRNGQNQILLAPKGFSFPQYKIYLPDGTVYDDGTRAGYESLSLRVMQSQEGICLIAPSQTGEYIYEVVLSWPEQGLTVTYGLKVVMTGAESNYDRAIDSIFAAYGKGNPLMAVTLVDKYILANAVYSSPRYLFKVENVPNAPIWVEVSQISGEIIAEVDDPEKWLVDPPYAAGQTHLSNGNTGERQMTLADVLALSKLGMELTWEDLKAYKGVVVGSGLQTAEYDIDPEFYLYVMGGEPTGKPTYAALHSRSSGANCDIRVRDVESFIKENQSDALDYAIHKAVIEHNADGTFTDVPSGLLPTESHRIWDIETKSGTPLENQTNHTEETTVYLHYVYTRYYHSGGNLECQAETSTAAAITFTITQNGYAVKEFWEPAPGKNYADEVRSKFPAEAAEQVLDPLTDGWFAKTLQDMNYSKAVGYLAETTGTAEFSGTPVAWLHDPSNTSGAYFRFAFDIPYTKIVASCDNGSLVDADSKTIKEIGTSITVGAGNALYWVPSLQDGQRHENTKVTFTLYDGETAIVSGILNLTGRKYQDNINAYIAALGCEGFELQINSQATGAVVAVVQE